MQQGEGFQQQQLFESARRSNRTKMHQGQPPSWEVSAKEASPQDGHDRGTFRIFSDLEPGIAEHFSSILSYVLLKYHQVSLLKLLLNHQPYGDFWGSVSI